jgi:hypothetical protein
MWLKTKNRTHMLRILREIADEHGYDLRDRSNRPNRSKDIPVSDLSSSEDVDDSECRMDEEPHSSDARTEKSVR